MDESLASLAWVVERNGGVSRFSCPLHLTSTGAWGFVRHNQMAAQMRYHATDNGHRLERFAPQLLRCPAITPPPHVAEGAL